MIERVDRRRAAEDDLIKIWRYIARDNQVAADAMLDRIEAKLATLARQLLLGSARSKRPHLRSVPVGNYTCFYLPTKHGITLIRVLHAAGDIPKTFRSR